MRVNVVSMRTCGLLHLNKGLLTCKMDVGILFILGLTSAFAVERSNFKTCDSIGYCKRHRALIPGDSSYVANAASLKVYPTSFSLDVFDNKSNIHFILEVVGLKDNMFRVRMAEAEPLRVRYEPPIGDVLIKKPEEEVLNCVEKSENQLTFDKGSCRLVLAMRPLRIDMFLNDDPAVFLNAQGLLKFEHSRLKREPNLSKTDSEHGVERKEESAEADEAYQDDADAEVSEPGLWEETFKSYTDSKPFGPESVGVDISFPGVAHVYGIPEHAESLALKTTKSTDPYRLFNLDVFEYELYNPMALYGSVPFMLGHSEKHTVGVFWLNTAETWIDISSNVDDKSVFSNIADYVTGSNDVPQTDIHWFSETGVIDVFVMLGPGPKDVFRQYSALTGTTPLPPLFAIAYHQCRWNYNDQDDVRTVDENFDRYDIPYDVIWLDIEHTDGKRYFTWDGTKFSNSVEMLSNISSKGRKMVTIVDPHLKWDDSYTVFQEAKSSGFLVKDKDESDYSGWCWPGNSGWPDFLDRRVRDWWAGKFSLSEYVGSDLNLFVWNDMNEPSVFNAPEITFHRDAKHLGGWENREVHNIYGMHVHESTMDGLLRRTDYQERAFVLTRAFFAGTQRSAAVWTGDNMGDWGHLKISMPMIMSLGLAGIAFGGADVGGFFKNPDNDLLTRWYQAGSFQPFFRAHAHLDTRRREPYLLPEEYIKVIRAAIQNRYSYLPFWYTLFHRCENDGAPVMRPLWVEFPKERATFGMDDVFMIGADILVKPVTEPGLTATSVYFPGAGEIWYDVYTYQTYVGQQAVNVPAPLSKVPVYQRGGTVVPRKMRPRRSSTLMFDDPFTLIVTLNATQQATGQLYIDDYHSFRYRRGAFGLIQYSFSHHKLHSKLLHGWKVYYTAEWLERVVIAGLPHIPKRITLQYSDFIRPDVNTSRASPMVTQATQNNDVYTAGRPSSGSELN